MERNWLQDGSSIMVHGRGHVIRHNRSDDVVVQINAGNVYFGTETNLGDPRCREASEWRSGCKWGLTPSIVKGGVCKGAHGAAEDCRVIGNQGRILVGRVLQRAGQAGEGDRPQRQLEAVRGPARPWLPCRDGRDHGLPTRPRYPPECSPWPRSVQLRRGGTLSEFHATWSRSFAHPPGLAVLAPPCSGFPLSAELLYFGLTAAPGMDWPPAQPQAEETAMATMRVVQVSAPNAALELVERERPEPGPGEARVRVQACGVCHSDSFTVEGAFPGIAYPGSPATRSPA